MSSILSIENARIANASAGLDPIINRAPLSCTQR